MVADPIAYGNYINRISKFRNDKIISEKENNKKLNIKDINNLVRKPPRILDQLYSPKNKSNIYQRDMRTKETIYIKSLDKVKKIIFHLAFGITQF